MNRTWNALMGRRRLLVGLAGLALTLWGCAGAPTGTSSTTTAAVPPPIEQPGPAPAAAAAPSSTTRVSKVEALDLADRTLVRVTATGPISGYQFQRPEARRFLLSLNNCEADPEAAVPANQSQLVTSLNWSSTGPGRLELVGALAQPFTEYEVRPDGRTVTVTLFTRPTERDGAAASAAGPGGKSAPLTASPTQPSGLVQSNQSAQSATVGAVGTLTPKQFSGKPISLVLQDADVTNVLRLLADISGKNIMVEPDVTGKVTIKVDKVPWDQILDMVLRVNDLGQEQVGNVIRIAKKEKLKKELQDSNDQVKARMDLYRAQQELQVASMDSGEITTEYLQVNYSKVDEVAAKIGDFKSPVGKVTVDPRTNLIIYADYPARIAQARELLDRLDQPNKQVLIEARIVELTATASRELGVTWTFNYSDTNDDKFYNQTFSVNHPVSGSSFLGFNIGKLLGQPLWDLDVLLQAAEQAGEGKIISAPRVLTMDNVTATITQGTEIPYNTPTGLTSSDSSGNLATVVTTSFKRADLELKVTPHVTPDRRVLMKIEAKKDRPNFAAAQPGQPPPINTRSIDTQLLVNDRDTIVIGGVLEETEDASESRTPGLHAVPILGMFFKSKQKLSERVELLIFISPRIVAGEI